MEFSITLKNFLKGRMTPPIQGSYFASLNLSPYLKKDVLTSKFHLKNEGKSSVLTNLTNVEAFVKRSTVRYAKSGKYIYFESNGVWSKDATEGHTDANVHTQTHLGAVIEPHANNLHWASNTAVGKYDGDWTDSWETGLTATDHYFLTVRDWTLVSNGRCIAGWQEADGSDWDLALLDLQPGYLSKRMLMKKAQGVRQVLIMATYATDRTKDGIFIWDTVAGSPLDFIPIPNLEDIFIDNNIVYAIHGNDSRLSQVLIQTSQLRPLTSMFDYPPVGSVQAPSTKFLGKFGSLILLGSGGWRDPSRRGDGFYPGLWAYNPEKNALTFWLVPSSGNLYKGYVYSALIDGTEVWVSSRSQNAAGTIEYYIDKLTAVSSGSGTFREMYISPILDARSINEKIWQKIKAAHNKFFSGSRMEIKYRDFSRDLNSYYSFQVKAVANNSITGILERGEVGDEITITAGPGSGQVRHIVSISGTAPTIKYTVDRDWDTNPEVDKSNFEVNSWKLMDYHDDANRKIHGKFSSFNDKDIHCQIKLVIEHSNLQSIDIKGLKIVGDLIPTE